MMHDEILEVDPSGTVFAMVGASAVTIVVLIQSFIIFLCDHDVPTMAWPWPWPLMRERTCAVIDRDARGPLTLALCVIALVSVVSATPSRHNVRLAMEAVLGTIAIAGLLAVLMEMVLRDDRASDALSSIVTAVVRAFT